MSNYPRTEFYHYDESAIPELDLPVSPRAPLFLYAITADKGPEEMMLIDRDFTKIYGIPSFEKHGQPSLQAALTLSNGGRLLVKRVVSDDAKLANTGIIAKVKQGDSIGDRVDENGDQLYELEDGKVIAIPEGDDVPEDATKLENYKAEIVYESVSVKDAKNEDDILVALEAVDSKEGEYDVFPIFFISDTGRGKSKKKFRIVPDFGASRSTDFMLYRINVLEGGKSIEEAAFSMDPDRFHLGEGYSLEDIVSGYSDQIRARISPDGINGLVDRIAELTGREDIMDMDFLFGNNKDMTEMEEVEVSEESVNLTDVFGLSLDNGEHGKLGDIPTENKEEMDDLFHAFFAGEVDDDIYDVERYPISAVIDANYEKKTKRAIEELCNFRGDTFFYADMGTDVSTIKQFEQRMREVSPIKEASHYGVYYDVYDDFTMKQITVTIGYSLAKLIPRHLTMGPHVPFAGKLHGAILEDAIDGTINFIPKSVPGNNQKEKMNDMRCNYVSYLDDELIIQTLYTANPKHTQLSYQNNVMQTQDLIRDIRRRCPASRYSFLHGKDLESYQKDVETVLAKHENRYKSLEFRYMQDAAMEQNKIYYAAIIVAHKDFAQAEIFNIHTINL